MNSFRPLFIYGTAWKEDDTERCVTDAVLAGFRAIDTANQRKHYYEKGVGDAIQKLINHKQIKREELFLQTKYTYQRGQDHRLPYDPEANFHVQVQQSFATSLEHLKTTYIDSYLLHGPFSAEDTTPADFEVWTAMTELLVSKKVRTLGVSNMSLAHLHTLFKQTAVRPSYLQNRCYARTKWDREIRNFCREHKVIYQPFSLLTANRTELQSPLFLSICDRHQKTPAQIVFRFAHQMGMVPLTGTTSPAHMREDLHIFDFELTSDELKQIENISGK